MDSYFPKRGCTVSVDEINKAKSRLVIWTQTFEASTGSDCWITTGLCCKALCRLWKMRKRSYLSVPEMYRDIRCVVSVCWIES